MPETKEFSLRDVLTVITGRLLTVPTEESNGIESLYSILEWMTGEPPFTHQLPRFAQECKPYLLEWFPELSLALAADGSLQKWIDSDQTANKQEGIRMWLTELKMMNSAIKDAYGVSRIPQDDHDSIDPRDELESMIDPEDVVVVVTSDQSE